jgi:hypothetical protein
MRVAASFLAVVMSLAMPARAERCSLPCEGVIAPRSGAIVPQNAPFFVGQREMQLSTRDGGLEPAPGLAGVRATFFIAGPLERGETLKASTADCVGARVEAEFSVGPPAARPGSLGTLTFTRAESREQQFCDSASSEPAVTLKPVLDVSPDLAPWLPLTNFLLVQGNTWAAESTWGAFDQSAGPRLELPEITVRCDSPVTHLALGRSRRQHLLGMQLGQLASCRAPGARADSTAGYAPQPLRFLWVAR